MSHPTFDQLDRTPEHRSRWLRDLGVTSAVAVLLSLSFVVGRLSAGHADDDADYAPRPVTATVAPVQVPGPAPSEVAAARAAQALRAGVRIAPVPALVSSPLPSELAAARVEQALRAGVQIQSK